MGGGGGGICMQQYSCTKQMYVFLGILLFSEFIFLMTVKIKH
jgi:hypothetical protein